MTIKVRACLWLGAAVPALVLGCAAHAAGGTLQSDRSVRGPASGAALRFALQDAPASGATAPQGASVAESDVAGTEGDIVVTARRRAEQVSKVPISISAFSSETLFAKGVNNTESLTRLTPGLAISSAGAKGVPFVVIRGQSRAVTGNGAPGVLTYVNDVPLPNAGSLIQTYDMENIQVLKGPQGTLFGRNAIGGAILTVTKAPTYNFEGYVSGTVAQYDSYEGEAAINLPIIEDRIALRVAAQAGHSSYGGKTYLLTPYTVDTSNPAAPRFIPGQFRPSKHNLDEYATQSYRVSLLVEPTDWIKSITVGDYSKIRGLPAPYAAFNTPFALYDKSPTTIFGALTQGSTNPAVVGFANLYANLIVPSLAQCGFNGPGPAASGPINCNVFSAREAAALGIKDRVNYTQADPWLTRTIIKGITNTTTVGLGEDHQLKNIFAYRETDNFQNASIVGLAPPILPTFLSRRLKQTTDELQLSGSFFGDKLKYTLGGFYLSEKPNGPGGSESNEVNAFFGLSHSFFATYANNKSKALYGQVDYSLDDFVEGLTVTAGLRQTWDSQAICTALQTPGGPFTSPLAPMLAVLTPADIAGVVGTESQCRSGVGLPGSGVSSVLPAAKFKKLTYTLGANWQIDPDAMVYVTHRRGYRGGGYNSPQIDQYLSSVQTFQPETLTDFEVGAKLRFRSGDMSGTLNVAAFTGKDKGAQVPVSTSNLGNVCVPQALGTPGHTTANCAVGTTPGSFVNIATLTTLVNAGELTIRGVEADATFSPIREVTFNGNLSYVDIKVDRLDFAKNVNFANFAAATGGRLVLPTTVEPQGQPTWMANAGVTVQYPGKILGGDLSASLDYHYSGSYLVVQVRVPGSRQFDLRLNLDDIGGTGLRASAWVKNLTDRQNYSGAASTSLTLGTISYQLAEPRTFGLTLRYEFGR